jgi:hypothetical protein
MQTVYPNNDSKKYVSKNIYPLLLLKSDFAGSASDAKYIPSWMGNATLPPSGKALQLTQLNVYIEK